MDSFLGKELFRIVKNYALLNLLVFAFLIWLGIDPIIHIYNVNIGYQEITKDELLSVPNDQNTRIKDNVKLSDYDTNFFDFPIYVSNFHYFYSINLDLVSATDVYVETNVQWVPNLNDSPPESEITSYFIISKSKIANIPMIVRIASMQESKNQKFNGIFRPLPPELKSILRSDKNVMRENIDLSKYYFDTTIKETKNEYGSFILGFFVWVLFLITVIRTVMIFVSKSRRPIFHSGVLRESLNVSETLNAIELEISFACHNKKEQKRRMVIRTENFEIIKSMFDVNIYPRIKKTNI